MLIIVADFDKLDSDIDSNMKYQYDWSYDASSCS